MKKNKVARKIPAIVIILFGVCLLYPQVLDYIPRLENPLPTIFLTVAGILISFSLILKSQRGLIFPGIIMLMSGLFWFLREKSFFPPILNGIIILPLIVAIAFLSLIPFEPKKRRAIIPSIAFFAVAGGVYLSQLKIEKIYKSITISPIEAIAFLLIIVGIYSFIKS